MKYNDDNGLLFGSIICTIMVIISMFVLGMILAWVVL